MNRKTPIIKALLFPFSALYGTINYVRNKAFDFNILPSNSYKIPTICVGNITVGGTGKTPHIEYLITHLSSLGNLATLSRGYKRKSSGFQVASFPPSVYAVGDEPAQIKLKFPEITVAVDGDRRNGIESILKSFPDIDVILLDDAYQHRYVKAGLNVLLIDYNRPIFKDLMLPSGDLREFSSGAKRADIIIITKCPDDINTDSIYKYYSSHHSVKTDQIFFSRYTYKNLVSVESGQEINQTQAFLADKSSLIVTGIASPKQLTEYISGSCHKTELISYPDHHNFTSEDIIDISKKFESIPSDKKIIITTEKDYSRIMAMNIPASLFEKMYYLPIQVEILNNQESQLLNSVKRYVKANSRNK